MPVPDLELVLEGLGHGLVRVDADHRILSANHPAQRHFHPTRLAVGERLPEPWPDVVLNNVVDSLLHRQGLSHRPQRVPGVVMDGHGPNGDAYRVTGFAPSGDLPVLLHIEDRSQMERRNRSEREFVANAAHELLTPLTGIVTAAFALEAGAKTVPTERDRFIAHIAHEADRLTRISRALLVLARAQSGQEPPRPEAFALRPLLEDVIAATIADHDSEVALDCAPALTVFVDRDLAEQAFRNLVANAGHHGRGATIAVTAGPIEPGEVRVAVSDTGEGAATDQVAHFGTRFYSGGGRDGGGFGLGVSIAAQAIELIGGTLTYDSAPGEGTRATVHLPSGRLATA
jgi:two-component system, OmpR family, phosphate regulon sensor histidine kinase PhoR